MTGECSNSEVIENYRFLAFFTKHHKKLLVAMEKTFLWQIDVSKRKNVCVLARLMKQSGSSCQEFALEAGGDWNPKQVFRIKSFKDILNLNNMLVSM